MIDMPPRRSLPPQIRDKMLVDLREKMDEKPHRSRTPYAVAAGVAALVAGGVVAVTALQGAPDPGVDTGKITGDTRGVAAEAQRCKDASTKVGGFPKNTDWRVLTHTGIAGYTGLAIKVGDKPVFCQTTATRVSLTKYDAKPNYVTGSKTGVLMQDSSMLIGMVVDPAWHGIDAYEDNVLDSRSNEYGGWKYVDGMALWWPEYKAPLTVAAHGKKPAVPLPEAPDAVVTVVDRPYRGPAPDRTSPGGKLLASCIERDAKKGYPLPEPESWQVGPMLTGDSDAIVVIRGIRQVTTCSRDGIPAVGLWGGELRVTGLAKGNRPVVSPAGWLLVRNGATRDIIFGSVPANAASMTMVTAEHKTITALVGNGMFIADARNYFDPDSPYPVITSVTMKDAHGKVLYHGKPAVSR